MHGCLMSWSQIKKILILKYHLLLFYATTMNHFLIGLWHVTKSGFYTTTIDYQLSDGTEKKLQRTTQSQSCTPPPKKKERERERGSLSLLGGVLLVWFTKAFWIPAKPLYLKSMLSKSIGAGAQSCTTLYNSMDCSSPCSSVHGTFQERILECVAISYSRGFSWPRDWPPISCVSYISRHILYYKHHQWTANRLLLFSRSIMSDSLQPHGLKHVSLPYPSPYLSSPRNSQESSSTPQFESINSSVQID